MRTHYAHIMKHKNAQIRYNVLNKCFRSTTKIYTVPDLLEECNKALEYEGYEGIKRRQLYKDISYMESEKGWSVEFEENLKVPTTKHYSKRGYRYKDVNFSIERASELNDEQKRIIKEALVTLKTASGVPQLDLINLDVICAQLRIGLEEKDEREEIYLRETSESYRDFSGGVFIEKIFNLIWEKRAAKIIYTNKKEKKESVIISGYLLKEYNLRWYLLGITKEYQPNTTLIALDKIIDIQETKEPYIKKPKHIHKDYFKNIVGVTLPKDGTPKDVVLKIKKEVWPILKARQLHWTMRPPVEHKDHVTVKFKIAPNTELENKILHWGENIVVVEPPELKERIMERTIEMMKNYNSAH